MDFRFSRYCLEPLMTCSLLACLPASLKWFDLKASDSYFSHCLVVLPSEPLVWKKNQYVSKWQCLFYIHRLPNSSSEAGCCRKHSHGPASPFSVMMDWSTCLSLPSSVRDWGCSSMAERLLHICQVLGSIPNTDPPKGLTTKVRFSALTHGMMLSTSPQCVW